jgi:hypothetical protein
MTTLAVEPSKPATLLDVLDHLQSNLQAVELDPAENDFESGYECALRDLTALYQSWL